MANSCAHLSTVANVSPSSTGCEDCLRIGGSVKESAGTQRLRQFNQGSMRGADTRTRLALSHNSERHRLRGGRGYRSSKPITARIRGVNDELAVYRDSELISARNGG